MLGSQWRPQKSVDVEQIIFIGHKYISGQVESKPSLAVFLVTRMTQFRFTFRR